MPLKGKSRCLTKLTRKRGSANNNTRNKAESRVVRRGKGVGFLRGAVDITNTADSRGI